LATSSEFFPVVLDIPSDLRDLEAKACSDASWSEFGSFNEPIDRSWCDG
jgi:hypothetical protein